MQQQGSQVMKKSLKFPTNRYSTLESEEQRQLLLRVVDGCAHLAPLAWEIKQMPRWNDVCKWLIASNLTGKNLLAYWMGEHKGSVLGVLMRIKQGIDREDKLKALRVGRDIL